MVPVAVVIIRDLTLAEICKCNTMLIMAKIKHRNAILFKNFRLKTQGIESFANPNEVSG